MLEKNKQVTVGETLSRYYTTREATFSVQLCV